MILFLSCNIITGNEINVIPGVERAPSPEVVEQSDIARYYANFDEDFFIIVKRSLEKSTHFFLKKLLKLRKSGNLKIETKGLMLVPNGDNNG
ncbi:hypothetical protein CEXT_280561, partial [Caerostris extrusa]